MPVFDDFEYTPQLVEEVLLNGSSHHLDQVDLQADAERALDWFKLEYPTMAAMVEAHVCGYDFVEIATWQQLSVAVVEEQLRHAYTIMAIWLNE